MSEKVQGGTRIGELLRDVAAAARAVEDAVAARDWPRAESTDTDLQRSLGAIEQLVAGIDPAGGQLESVTSCLAEALERYERATALVCNARDAAATELRSLRGSRHGAARYEEAADT